MVGGAGNDLLFGEAGDDKMYGGAGDDYYVHFASDGVDIINDNKTATGSTGGGGGSGIVHMGLNLSDLRTLHPAGTNDLLIGTASDLADGVLSDGVTLEGFFSTAANRIEYVQSADGYTASLTNVT